MASAAILIVTGSIVSIISFLGTFGAYKEVKCMLLTYFVILVILFIVMITAGILGYVFRLEVDDRMQQEMHSTMKLYGYDSQVTQAWDAVQQHVSGPCLTLFSLGGLFQCQPASQLALSLLRPQPVLNTTTTITEPPVKD